MPLCVQCPRTYARDEFRSSTRWETSSPTPPRPSRRLASLLERTPVLAFRAQNRRIQRALTCSGWGPPGGVRRTCPASGLREVKAIVIGLIGPTATTKSSYLGSLLYQLTNHAILNDMGLRSPHGRAVPSTMGTALRRPAAQQAGSRHHVAARSRGADPAAGCADDRTPSGRPRRALRPGLLRLGRRGPADRPRRRRAQPVRATDARRAAVLHTQSPAVPAGRLPDPDGGAVPDRSRPEPGGRHLHHPAGPAEPAPAYLGKHPTRDLPVAAVLSKADELTELVDREFGGGFPSLALDGSYFDNPLELQGSRAAAV